ncbi:hypothetical protein BC941DRAFT_487787 [Chlamydoabsidia padenii]|nr:hypothetical protein BC941DRAFT_487787 [Chlamydoabsidia padenii]
MSPRGRGGGTITIGGGDDSGSSVDPGTLSNYFTYATLGVYGLYFIYILMVILAQKSHFPYLYLYAIISCGLLSSVLQVVSLVTVGSGGPCSSASAVYFNLMLFLIWLFLFEPSRRIQLRHSPLVSPWKISQYTSSAVGIIVLCGYGWAILLFVLSIVYAIIPYYVEPTSYVGLGYFLVYSPWLFVLMWFYLAAVHWQHIGDKRSYGIYAFFAFCIQVGVTLTNSPGVFVYTGINSLFAPVIVGFVMIACCHFIALYFAVTKAGEWVTTARYDFISNQK